jgi:glycosyltransferase involved in cell wall biosynthesis
MSVKYSIVVPAYNEERRIPLMLDRYAPFFCGNGRSDTELIVVVNGSTDRTEEVVHGYARKYENIRVLVEPERVGKGVAVIMGIRSIRGEYGGFVDADGATAPEAFQKLIDHRRDADCIIASRYLPESVAEPRQPLSRRLASRAFNLFVRLMFGLRLSDTQCGAKLIKRAALETVLPDLGRTQWAFDVDLLFQLKRHGFEIMEIPTVWRDVAGSKLKILPASITMFISMCRLRLLYSPFKWVITVYNRTIGRWIPHG